MTTVPKPSDLTGTYACKYDAWNRLAEVKAGEIVVARYEYDALNRRTKKCVDADLNGYFDEFRHFYYNSGWQILETRKTTSVDDPPDEAKPEIQYVWSLRYIDAPVLRDENKDNDDDCIDGTDERLYYLTDANMNVTCLVEDDGDVAERYVYNPYGDVRVYSGNWSTELTVWAASKKNNIRYCGYFFDDETGLYSVRHRYYHPTLGRWLSRNPSGYADGMSLYESLSSNSVNRTDPAGLETQRHAFYAPESFADTVINDLKKLCECFEYRKAGTEKGIVKITISSVPTGGAEKDKFCCCYYQHLPGCNMVLWYGKSGTSKRKYKDSEQRMWPDDEIGIQPYGWKEAWLNRGGHQTGTGPFAYIGHEAGNSRGLGQEIFHGVSGLRENEAEYMTDTYNWAMDADPNKLPYGNLSEKRWQEVLAVAALLLSDQAGCEEVMKGQGAKGRTDYDKAMNAKANYDKMFDNLKKAYAKYRMERR